MSPKRILALLLALSLLLAAVACDSGSDTPLDSDSSASSDTSPAETDPKETDPPETNPPETDPPGPTQYTIPASQVTIGSGAVALTKLTPLEADPATFTVFDKQSAPSIGVGTLTASYGMTLTPSAPNQEVSLVYSLPDSVFGFAVIVGLADTVDKSASGEFKVIGDGVELASSGVLKHGELITFNIETFGCTTLTIVFTVHGTTAASGVLAYPTFFEDSASKLSLKVNHISNADAFVDTLDWKSYKNVGTIPTPLKNKNDGGGKISLGAGSLLPSHAVWLHPNAGNIQRTYAEVVYKLTGTDLTTFYLAYGLEDGYLSTAPSTMGTVNKSMRSVTVSVLVNDEVVFSSDVVNVAKIGFAEIDITGASTLTVRVYNFDATHTCDATAFAGGFTVLPAIHEVSTETGFVEEPEDDTPPPQSDPIPAAPVTLPNTGDTLWLEDENYYYTLDKSAFIPKNHFPKDDLLICVANIMDYGAKADGVTNDTGALRSALEAAKKAGGGTVYMPAGTYLIASTITIPAGVTLSGDWVSPEEAAAGTRGTIILTDFGRNNAGTSLGLFVPGLSSGIRNLTIYYPNQNPEKPVPYSPTILMAANSQPVFENLTIVNAWTAIHLGVGGCSGLSSINNTYITALNLGIYLDMTLDITRFEGVHISPRYWAENVINPLTDAQIAALEEYTFQNTTGAILMRGDGTGIYDVSFELCKVGMLLTNSPTGNGCTSGSITLFEARNCQIGLHVEYAHAVGTSITGFTATATRLCTAAILTDTTYKENLKLQDVTIRGSFSTGIIAKSAPVIGITSGILSISDNAPALNGVDASFICTSVTFETDCISQISGQKGMLGLYACTIPENADITIKAAKNLIRKDDAEGAKQIPGYHVYKETLPMPESLRIVSITQFGAVAGGKLGCSDAIQAALDYMGDLGGGVVLIPAGKFLLDKPITVPSGVELVGLLGNWCYIASAFESSCLLIRAGEYDKDGEAAINLEANSGLRGFVAWYPNQNYKKPIPYSYAIRSHGENCYAINLNIPNPYRFLDFGSVCSDGHYVRCCAGCFIETGMFFGNNQTEGWVENVHLNQHQPYELGNNGISGGYLPSEFNTVVYDILIKSAEAYIFGYNENEHVLGLFSLGQKIGYKFIEQNGRGTSGIFIQTCSDGCANSYTIEQAEELYLIDSGSVALGNQLRSYVRTHSTFTGSLYLLGGGGFGDPSYCLLIEGGSIHAQSFTFASFSGNCPVYLIDADSLTLVANIIPFTAPQSSRKSNRFDGILIDDHNYCLASSGSSWQEIKLFP